MRDAGRTYRRGGADRERVRRAETRLYAPAPGGGTEGCAAEGGSESSDGADRGESESMVSGEARISAPDGKPYQGGGRRFDRGQGGADTRRGGRVGLRQDHAGPGGAETHPVRGADRLSRAANRRVRCGRHAAAQERDADRVPG